MENITTDIFEMPFACGCCFILAAVIMYLFPAKKINNWYGYKSGTSMASPQAWNFAQRYSVYQMIKGGIFMVIISFAGLVFQKSDEMDGALGIPLLLAVTLYIFVSTEKAIKKQFPNS